MNYYPKRSKMALNKKKIIYQGTFKFVDLGGEMSITDYTYKILTTIGGISNSEALEYVSKYSKSIKNNFLKQNDDLKKRGLTIVGNTDISDRISWKTDSSIQHFVWQIRPLYLEIIDSLSDEKFEALCCLCMCLVGGKAWRTKNKGDGNIDLYSIVDSKMSNHLFGHANKFKVVGQCKNYSHEESITNFESFFRALENVKFQTSRVVNDMPNEFMRTTGPILGWYVCKDGFQSGIIDEARKHGVILSDKYDLVEILIKLELKGIFSSFNTKCKVNLAREIGIHV
ncbi:hypothetical protein BH11BAC3_BH11BAC3_06780 [soil metagenome]